MADVTVQFGAKIDELINGVNQVKAQLQSIGVTSKETAEGMVPVWANALLEIGEKIAHVIEWFTRLGTTTRSVSLSLGIGTEQVAGLDFAARESGLTLQTLVTAMEQLTVSAQRASRDALGVQAQAFKNLGIDVRAFMALPITERWIMLANAAKNAANEHGHVTDNLKALIPRQTDVIAAALRGGDAFQHAREEGSKLAGVTEDQTKELEKLDHEWNILTQTMKGWAVSVSKDVNTIFQATKREAEGIIGVIERIRDSQNKAEADAEKRFTKLLERNAKASTFNERFLAIGAGFAPFTPAAGEGGGPGEPPPPESDLRQQLSIAQAGIEQRLAQQKGYQDRLKLQFEQNAVTYSMTEMQRVQATAQANVSIAAIELNAAKEKAELWRADPLKYAEAQREIVIAQQKFNLAVKQGNVDTTKTIAQEWNQVSGMISSSFTSHIRSMLDGTESLKEGFGRAMGDMVIKIIELVVQMTIAIGIMTAMKAMFPELAPMSALSGLIGSIFGASNKISGGSAGAIYQEGTPFVPTTGLALIHRGEMVIPQGMAEAVRSGQSGIGGTNVHVSVSAWDGASVAAWLKGGGAHQLSKALARNWNQNPNMRPGY